MKARGRIVVLLLDNFRRHEMLWSILVAMMAYLMLELFGYPPYVLPDIRRWIKELFGHGKHTIGGP